MPRKIFWLLCAGLVVLFVSGGVVNANAITDAELYEHTKTLAAQGDAEAQSLLGIMYALGKGVAQDYKEAVKWYKRAAEQGDATAQFNLGVMYANGDGVAQDYKEAVKWSRKAAEQGFASAQFVLGLKYVLGKGVTQDFVQAHMFWNIAAATGHSSAGDDRDKVAAMMTSEQIAEAQRLAREWMTKYPQ